MAGRAPVRSPGARPTAGSGVDTRTSERPIDGRPSSCRDAEGGCPSCPASAANVSWWCRWVWGRAAVATPAALRDLILSLSCESRWRTASRPWACRSGWSREGSHREARAGSKIKNASLPPPRLSHNHDFVGLVKGGLPQVERSEVQINQGQCRNSEQRNRHKRRRVNKTCLISLPRSQGCQKHDF